MKTKLLTFMAALAVAIPAYSKSPGDVLFTVWNGTTNDPIWSTKGTDNILTTDGSGNLVWQTKSTYQTTISSGTTAQFYRGDKTFVTLNVAALADTKTGTGNIVLAQSPTITTPTFTRSSVGLVFTSQDNNGCSATMTTDSSGRNFFVVNGKSGATSFGGSYVQLNGYEEAWAMLNVLSNTSGQRVMRFGTLSNRFSIQRLNDAITSITATPFSFANDAPTNSFYMSTSGGVALGSTSDPGAGGLQTNGRIISGAQMRLKSYTVATLPAGSVAFDQVGVTDATSPTVGATVAGGGSAKAVVTYNGTNWIVTGVL